MKRRLIQIAVFLATFSLCMATYAAYVGVMADSSTGTVVPPSLESRLSSLPGMATMQWVIDYVAANTTPTDMTNEPAFKGWTNLYHVPLMAHLAATNSNPHGITPAMIGAAGTGEVLSAIAAAIAPLATTMQLAQVQAAIPSTNGLASTSYVAAAVAPLASTTQLAAAVAPLVSTSAYFNVTTGGSVRATDFKLVSGGVTTQVPVSVSANGQTNFADAAGNIDLGAIGGTSSGTVTGQSINVGTENTLTPTYGYVFGTRCGVTGLNSVAMGYRASATHKNAFVWSDASSESAFNTANSNTFNVRAHGGIYLDGDVIQSDDYSITTHRIYHENLIELDSQEIFMYGAVEIPINQGTFRLGGVVMSTGIVAVVANSVTSRPNASGIIDLGTLAASAHTQGWHTITGDVARIGGTNDTAIDGPGGQITFGGSQRLSLDTLQLIGNWSTYGAFGVVGGTLTVEKPGNINFDSSSDSTCMQLVKWTSMGGQYNGLGFPDNTLHVMSSAYGGSLYKVMVDTDADTNAFTLTRPIEVKQTSGGTSYFSVTPTGMYINGSAYYVDTNGVQRSKRSVKVGDTTNDYGTTIIVNGTTNTANTNGVWDLGTVAGGSGATQLIANVAGAAARTTTLAGAVLTLADLPLPAASSNAANLTNFPLSVWANGTNYPASVSNTFNLGTIGGGGGTTVLTNASGERWTIWLASTSTAPTISPTNYSWGYAPSVSNTLTIAAKSSATNHATLRVRCHIATGVTCTASGFTWPSGIVPPFVGELEFVSLPASTNWSCRIAERRVAGVPSAYDDATSVWWPSRTGTSADMLGRNNALFSTSNSIGANGWNYTNSGANVSYGKKRGRFDGLEPGTGAFSLGAWYYPSATQHAMILGRGFLTSGPKWYITCGTTSVYAEVGSSGTLIHAPAATTGAWNHILITYAPGVGATVYAGGLPVATNASVSFDASSLIFPDNTTPFSVGNYYTSVHAPGTSYTFSGFIDAGAYWNRALTAAEAAAIYAIGRSP